MRMRLNGMVILGAALVLVFLAARPAGAQAAQQGQPSYTIPEYNAFQAAAAEKDPQAQIKDLDDFVAKFPNSTLMPYVYESYYQAYLGAKNYAKSLEYADKLIAMGDKAEVARRFKAIVVRTQQLFPAVFNAKAPDATDQLTKERDTALLGLKMVPDFKKAQPDVPDDTIKTLTFGFETTIGAADLQLKDYAAASEAFKAALAINPNDAPASYRLGLSYLNMAPPMSLDGFWAIARAINQKIQGADKVKDYLRSKILAYEQPGCDTQVDAQLNELLQLAANSPDRPATYTIPSHDDLSKISQASTIISVIADLNGGGDKAKMTWLAICGAEFPEVVGKIIDVQKTDPAYVSFLVFTSASADEMQAATMANLSVKVWVTAPPAAANAGQVTPQPDVVRLGKDDEIRFAGTLVSYDPSPFLLHWDQVKVDPSILPEKGAAKKPAARRPAAKPSN
jgi:tetratricopeptide (TPR) repeat protein